MLLPKGLNWTSPVRWLVPRVMNITRLAAPEQAATSDPVGNVRWAFSPLARFQIDYNGANGFVTSSRKALEMIWAFCFAYDLAYRSCPEQLLQSRGGETAADIRQEFGIAVDLLAWTTTGWLTEADAPWPSALPEPVDEEIEDETQRRVRRIFDVVMAFILHHRVLDWLPDRAYDVEQDIDSQVARHLLESVADDPEKFIHRAHGVTIALAILAVRATYRYKINPRVPARTFERLPDTLSRHFPSGSHPAWRMAVSILRIHLNAPQVPIIGSEYRNAREYVEFYSKVISQ